VPNARSIPQEVWEQVFEALVLFFRHRGSRDPDDEAQNTLLAMLKRDDYEFENVGDIHVVAKGFAKLIAFEAYRRAEKIRESPLEPLEPLLATPRHSAGSPEAIEARIYLEDVCRIAAAKLRQKELDAIRRAVDASPSAPSGALTAGELNKRRVFLHRSRQKLGRLLRGVMRDE
jgi:hypothetical protein